MFRALILALVGNPLFHLTQLCADVAVWQILRRFSDCLST